MGKDGGHIWVADPGLKRAKHSLACTRIAPSPPLYTQQQLTLLGREMSAPLLASMSTTAWLPTSHACQKAVLPTCKRSGG